MNQKEFRRNCKCAECEYMIVEQTTSDDRQICTKMAEVIEDMRFGKDRCRYTK